MDDRFRKKKPAGTGKLPPRPSQAPSPSGGTGSLGSQGQPFVVRLDPTSAPGDFNFVIDGPAEVSRRVPEAGLTADVSGAIPPQLYKAVDEILGFIYGLDQQAEQTRKGRK
jgi:hypothetical protein